MIKKERWTSVHHVCPSSRWGTSDRRNLLEIKDNLHRSFHHLFANKLIAEQLLTTIDLSRKALRPEVTERLVETLTAHDASDLDFWYKDGTHF